ncbi:MAG: T9SS type A sorting domain-containing protein [Bacteroidales bacterium]|nr:T9SS type A sorting domain-containing protein [Bacteroidales bacterium]MCF8456933.1 T9SS type A sorting domain-containing protein [Bacteroidales bacterium]
MKASKNSKLIILVFLSAILSFSSYSQTPPIVSDTVDVLNYEIHLDISSLTASNFAGWTKVTFLPKMNNLEYIPLELWNLQVDYVLFENILMPPSTISHIGKALRIHIPPNLQTTDTSLIEIHYHGTPPVDPTGWGGFIFENNMMAYNLGIGFGADPHNLGKSWFPCVDDFIDRATYEYFITTSLNNSAVCGGEFIATYPDPANPAKQIHHWKLDREIPTYLASVAVANWQTYSDTYYGIEDTILIEIYTHSTSVASGVSGAVVNLKAALASYESRFGPYKWPRVGYVGTTIGAMEHSCNIAFPYYYFNGTTSGESTLVHELAHHWFGNLFTCASAPEMWINEGGASFCEYVFMEDVHGIDAAKEYIRNNHADNLRVLQHTEGWFALHGVNHSQTYSKTVYEKGADVIHSMRGYLGDDLFFDAIKAMGEDFAFKDIGTQEFCNFMTSETGIDMQGFFDAYLYAPGWTHFSVDSFTVTPTPTLNEVTVYVRQKLKEAPAFAQNNRLEISFIDENWNRQTEMIEFSGELGQQTFQLPIVPIAVMLDLEERFSDATTDYYMVIDTALVKYFEKAYFILEVDQIGDSAFFRVEHNWVAPDPLQTPDPTFTLSDSRYWKIDGVFPATFEGKFKFNYNNKVNGDGWLDYTWFPYPLSADSLVVLYRPGTWADWQVVPSVKLGTSMSGYRVTETLAKGEYCLAYRDRTLSSSLLIKDEKEILLAFPNPSKEIIHVQVELNQKKEIKLFDSLGSEVYSKRMEDNENSARINVRNFGIGVYFLELRSNNQQEAKIKIVVSR